jgi:tetratricopeptide (TPR) repeat protein
MVAPLSHTPIERIRSLIDDARAAERGDAPEEALACYDEALELLGDRQLEVLADVLRWKGTVLRERGETAAACALYERSAEVADALSYTAGKAHALNCLAIIAQRRGELEESERLYEQAAQLGMAADDQRLLGMIQQNLGIIANIRGNLDVALVRYRLSLQAFEAAGDDELATLTLNNLGMLYTDQGSFVEAEAAYERALTLARGRGDARVERAIELNRVEMLIAAAKWAEADEKCARSLRAAEDRGDALRHAEALKFLGMIERHREKYDRSTAALTEAQELAWESEDVLLSAELLFELGETWHRRGEAQEARSAWEEAATVFDRLGASPDADELRSRLAALRV